MDIPSALLSARRVLDGIQEYTLLNDLRWEPIQKKWYLKFSITIEEAIKIDKVTYWVVTLDSIYPKGCIDVFSDAKKGICNTYPHQSNNGLVAENGIWKSGKLCLDEPKFSTVPNLQNNEFKLEWFILRTVQWIEKANHSELLYNGDWFELPQYNITLPMTIAYDEDEVSSMIWESHDATYGYVHLKKINDNAVYSVILYQDLARHTVYQPIWGDYISKTKSEPSYVTGVWVLMNQLLVINNWQAPNTFGELKIAFQNQNMNLVEILVQLFPKLRDGERHFLLLGFPIPYKIGEKPSIISWKALLLPRLSNGKRYAKGFRNNELGWLKKDFDEILINKILLDWVTTDNWNANNILSRGKYNSSITRKKYLVIGAGTLSAFMCEQLVRNGVENITIVDSDRFHAGNLSRHLLNIQDISKYKATALSDRLNLINPHARIKAINDEVKLDNNYIFNLKDVIIDCSANDEVLKIVSELSFKSKVMFFSVSFGYKAEQLYIAAQQAETFSYETFTDIFGDVIQEDIKKCRLEDMPWEGIGCWSPVFPAKTSDVMLAAATATEIITHFLRKGETTNKNFIYKKEYDEDGFLIGYRQINHEI
ncbi:ThiF family adenylyltransferase [Clostridium sp.]|uniref:ThiF family adenylyltransferase n=1 Tax=Clostridium sp. TaxID=1506 RepID=UPI002613012A|nr:ThiF family adenylyltransferase [uncultured Clostridium sp.]